eukprot:TRINITY_DN2481_c0_g1_i1.p1 TRINITY_DN2481_c0_g1~~TRINITY_DN2481_c0_g1_i1.p1  ORF type:complete len:342 (-),score=104.13 TRINITY_DN2481_c0_g1_i1:7-1032(-)
MATWTKVQGEGEAPKGRSSHSVTVVPGSNKVYIYGGEDIPRRAFDTKIHSFDFNTKKWESIESKNAPDARLAHTTSAVGDRLFVFGGRKTHGQSIYDSQEALDLNELFVFNSSNNEWSQIQSNSESSIPIKRSFHAATSTPDSFIVFGGCTGHDRLNDLWQFNPEKSQWIQLASQSSKTPTVRGGPALSSTSPHTLYLHGGYQGSLGEAEDLWVFDTRSNQWTSLNEGLQSNEKPLARSVHSLVNLDGKKLFTWGGEGVASKLGHLGAGEFFGDSWYYDIEGRKWRQAENEEERSRVEERPSARGWFAMDRLSDRQVVLFGGLDGTKGDERLGDLYVFNAE